MLTTILITWLSGWLATSLCFTVWTVFLIIRVRKITDVSGLSDQTCLLISSSVLHWLMYPKISSRASMIVVMFLGYCRAFIFTWPLVLITLLVVRDRKGR